MEEIYISDINNVWSDRRGKPLVEINVELINDKESTIDEVVLQVDIIKFMRAFDHKKMSQIKQDALKYISEL